MLKSLCNIEPLSKTGAKVRIINYGHPMFISKRGFQEEDKAFQKMMFNHECLMIWGKVPTQDELNKIEGRQSPSNILFENDEFWICDISPELVGQEGVVEKSKITQGKIQYVLQGIKGKSAWYDEKQLELIK